ncbi:sensor histidine kinase [Bordetella petrii]|uniref:sensor histidine kinase n=1 Tax=Bordetella petrii TaxID=94624 RepID=UPI001E4BB6DC|nr:HAMP domain-containing sensor histidine kinase [Bordetella petrii]MCD0502189.1 HAMP domain-containing histidine kinase [Bordetella petrii]
MKQGSVTQRVVWALTGAVAVFVAALALLAYLTFDQMEDGLVNQILTTEAQRVAQHVATDPDFLDTRGLKELGGSMRAWLRDTAVPADMPEQLQGLAPGLHELQPGIETWHVLVMDTERGRLYVLYDASDHESRVRDFGLVVLGMGALCIIAAYALARRVAAIAVGPLLDLTRRLADWAPGSPDMAVTRDDEAGRLIEAFNRVQNQVDRSIAREREFAANISHEMRTPLAAIRSDSEIMLLDTALPADPRQRLSRILTNVDHIVASFESARSVAREQRRPAEPVDLAVCVGEAWRGLEAMAEASRLVFDNQIPAGTTRTLDKYALLTVMRNLIRNAIEHATPATLTARLTPDGAIELCDTGKGIASHELPFVFQRYYSGRLGDTVAQDTPAGDDFAHGLGLAIAKSVCDMQGWKLDVQSRHGGPATGTCFSLRIA